MSIEIDPEQLALLQLNLISGLGPRLQSRLLEAFGSGQAVFQASGQELLSVERLGVKTSAAITQHRSLSEAREEWQRAVDHGITLSFRTQAEYPRLLSEIHDPPIVLYGRGEVQSQDALSVAIVGSRRCTHYGTTQARKIAAGLARAGITVISGMARGIDAAAHEGALEAGGRTLAVCAPGLLHIYPPEHVDLAGRIQQQGALLSESPLQRQPMPALFPQRNRIISGLSLGVIVIEAGRKSGSLHTARHALEQGREVFAVPGRIDSIESEGSLDLLRGGATLIRGVEDVLESLGPLMQPVTIQSAAKPEKVAVPRELSLNEVEREVLNLVEFVPTAVDIVLSRATLDLSQVLSTLTVLEMRRLVRRLPGGLVERTTG
ncbi:DNA-processing protein DprA [Planctomicrobium sp. SH664]|uniref:DNA-processing protein DprA n=1 Tax=Planctomicrobium sp. SH664 TaxID=3448125 RepID=UPI003F5B04EB